MRPIGQALVALGCMAAAAGLSLAAIANGRAGTTVYAVAKEMSTWAASGNRPGAETVRWLMADLERAGRAAPGDPNIEELLGSLALRRIDRPQFLDEARAHYARAVALRPSSPYSWANLATVDYRRGETGPQFQAALRHAAVLGPAEPEVQRTVAEYGLAIWDEAQPQTRSAVEASITGAMRRDPRKILQIAERRGRLAVACRHVGDAVHAADPVWNQVCASREDKR